MSVATVDTTAADVETALAYGARVTELRRFVDEDMKPAIERLEAAGYPGVDNLETALDVDPLMDGEFSIDMVDVFRVANGQPGAADWLFWRTHNWESLDSARAEAGDDKADALVAFDRQFSDAYPKLAKLIARVACAKRPPHDHVWDVEEFGGRPIKDIEAEIREAVAKLTGAATR